MSGRAIAGDVDQSLDVEDFNVDVLVEGATSHHANVP